MDLTQLNRGRAISKVPDAEFLPTTELRMADTGGVLDSIILTSNHDLSCLARAYLFSRDGRSEWAKSAADCRDMLGNPWLGNFLIDPNEEFYGLLEETRLRLPELQFFHLPAIGTAKWRPLPLANKHLSKSGWTEFCSTVNKHRAY